jgi:hypothetical protein
MPVHEAAKNQGERKMSRFTGKFRELERSAEELS